jgi:2,5-diamino-6-(ribosylamino)-4(3H)-pyrimidinone 5'-phosphate reductase
MLPKVIIYNNLSLDGRINGFNTDYDLYYRIASELSSDAVLMDIDTLLKRFNTKNIDITEDKEFTVNKVNNEDIRPLLVVPDIYGKIHNWNKVLENSLFKDILVLCSRSTPQQYLNFLEERYIKYMIIGYDKVNFGTALEELNIQFGVKNIRVESGGKLNGTLLRDELVDEICVLFYPNMVGGISSDSIYTAPDLNSIDGVLDLKLLNMEKLKNEIIMLHYRIMKYQF